MERVESESRIRPGKGEAPVAHRPTAHRGSATGLERWLAGHMLTALGGPAIHLVLWDGQIISVSADPPSARLLIHDRATLYRLIRDPEFQFGEAFSSGHVEVDGDLVRFVEGINRSYHRAPSGLGDRLLQQIYHPRRPPANTPERARQNIQHHYDLGNDFYALWLDRQMVYTCAYFPTPETGLEEAQVAKFDHVCRKLRLQAGERVVEAGCGWGGLALHMARHYGVRVRAYNISREQLAFARERARAEGLADRVSFIEEDYRDITGPCDAFVSVGMLEHVGPAGYDALGRTIDRCLTPGGRGLIHTIGRDAPGPMNAWIERRIFPGAYPPSIQEMMALFEPRRFSVLDLENLRLHYALTIRHWLDRFEAVAPEVAERFDASFVRAWRLYLAGSLAAFNTGHLQLFQVLFTRSGTNNIPWSRAHLYQ